MNIVRTLSVIAFPVALTACSGNLGGGQSTLPGTPQSGTSNIQQVAVASPTPTPNSASNVATSGSSAVQQLPVINGWGGTIAFVSSSPAPSAGAKSATQSAAATPVSIGVTSGIVEPADSPHFNTLPHHHHAANAPTGLFFISLLATADVPLDHYPQIAIDVPRDIVTKYHGDTFALALYDPDQKSKTYRLDVAVRDVNAAPIGTLPATPVPTATPTATPTPTPMPFPMPGSSTMGVLTPPPLATAPPAARSGLPPEQIAFLPTAAKLTLHENEPVIFVLYVVPAAASPAPSPSPTAAAKPSPSPTPSPSSPAPAASASPTG